MSEFALFDTPIGRCGVAWDGDAGQQLRLRLAIAAGVPTIRELAVRRGHGPAHHH